MSELAERLVGAVSRVVDSRYADAAVVAVLLELDKGIDDLPDYEPSYYGLDLLRLADEIDGARRAG